MYFYYGPLNFFYCPSCLSYFLAALGKSHGSPIQLYSAHTVQTSWFIKILQDKKNTVFYGLFWCCHPPVIKYTTETTKPTRVLKVMDCILWNANILPRYPFLFEKTEYFLGCSEIDSMNILSPWEMFCTEK